MELKGLDISEYQDLFTHAKESFEKGDYETAGNFIRKIMTISKQTLQPEPEQSIPASGKKLEPESEVDTKSKAPVKVKTLVKKKFTKEQVAKFTPEQREVYDKL